MPGLGTDVPEFDELAEHEVDASEVGVVVGGVVESGFDFFDGCGADYLVEG